MRRLTVLLAVQLCLLFAAIPAVAQTGGGNTSWRGDLNEDGKVDIFDLLALLKVLGSGSQPTGRQQVIANVDQSADGTVNIFDLLALLRVLSGAEKPGTIYWGPPALTGISPSTAAPGDTLEVFVSNLPPEAGVKVLLDSRETPFSRHGGASLRLAVPDSFAGGWLRLAVGTDTLGPVFVNLRNINPPVIAGCQIFPDDNPWNQAVDRLPRDPNSDNYVTSIGLFSHLHPDFGSNPSYGFPFVKVGGGQPRVPLTFSYPDESDPGPYPIPPNAPIEGGSASTGDRHVLVLDTTNCMLYETFSSYYQPPGWRAGSGAVFDLRSNALRPDTWTSSDAAGLPILPGLVRYEEVAAGEVNHAIRFTIVNSQRKYVYPATHFASSSLDPNRPPMGLRLRLKADYKITGFSGQALVILKALKKYGIIVADNGSDWFISGESNRLWKDDNLEQLKNVPGSAFEVVDASAMVVSGKDERRNIWPAVTLTAPAEGAAFTAGTPVTLTAEAVDYDGSVSRVEFFQDSVKLGEAASEPWTIPWTAPAPGTYSLTARAVDNGGASNTSYPVGITVSGGL
jgi:hypothetical protein